MGLNKTTLFSGCGCTDISDKMNNILSIFVLLSISLSLIKCDDVIEFTDNDFENKIGDHDMAVVMFYAPWCGHCKKLKPEFERAATILKANDPPVALAKVDCTEGGKDTCGKFSVSGYPTLKIFRSGGSPQEYNGPRDANGIVKYLRAQVGPASKELHKLSEAQDFLSKAEVAVVYFGQETKLKEVFLKVANKLRESVRFAHSSSEDISKEYGFNDAIVLFRPKVLHNKFEPNNVLYEGTEDLKVFESFIKSNFHGLVGHRTQDTAQDFKAPLVVAYYDVDYVKNHKGTNYWRNRVLKVGQNYAKDVSFAVSNKNEFQHELNEFGLDFIAGDKPVICARNEQGQKFVMKEEFSMETLETFLKAFLAGELEPYMKSEPVPDQDGPVLVAVGKNFDELVTNSGRDALIEFYAPWCGHCKKLAPTFDELGEKMKGEDVDIIKMDATANDVPSTFNVRGFPTLFWKPKDGSPVSYEGGRELDDFIKYIAKRSTEELNGWDRSGKTKKTEL